MTQQTEQTPRTSPPPSQPSPLRDIYLANPRGFCAGVERAIAIVGEVLNQHGAPVYVKHEIVHNRTIVEDFKKKGVIFIEDPNEVPEGAILVYSAHGVSDAIRAAAARRRLNIFDATCPLVTKVHSEVKRLRAAGSEVIMIGHAGHPEVEGTLGQCADGVYLIENAQEAAALSVADDSRLAYVTQTTLSVDDTADIIAALKRRFPRIAAPKKSDICYATQNRQDAVKAMADKCDIVLVVGSQESSNSQRLCEVARKRGTASYLIDTADDINPAWFNGARALGITAGASAPEALVREVIALLKQRFPQAAVHALSGAEENIVFSIPKKLARRT